MEDFSNPLTAEMLKLCNEITTAIDRLNHEYNKFFGGAEKKPPLKLRAQLDKLNDRLRAVMRQSPNLSTTLRIQNATQRYSTYVAMWDKRMEKFEKTGSSI